MTEARELRPAIGGIDTGESLEKRASFAPAPFHAVRFYESDSSLARIVADFLQGGSDLSTPGIVVATGALRVAIIEELTARGVNVAALQRSGNLLLLDADETLSTFMVAGQPDERRFTDRMCQAIRRVRDGQATCTVRLFGQMTDVLWKNGERDAAIKLEVLWNQLANSEGQSLLCGYAMGNFYKSASFDDICRQRADGKAQWPSLDGSGAS